MTNTCAHVSASNSLVKTKRPALKHVLKCRPIVVLIGGIRRGIKRLELFRFCCGVRVDRGLAFPHRVQAAQYSPFQSLWLSHQPTWRRPVPE